VHLLLQEDEDRTLRKDREIEILEIDILGIDILGIDDDQDPVLEDEDALVKNPRQNLERWQFLI